MCNISKNQFRYESFVLAGKRSKEYESSPDIYDVIFTDENGVDHRADIIDLYSLNVFQFANPSQEALQNAKEWVLKNEAPRSTQG